MDITHIRDGTFLLSVKNHELPSQHSHEEWVKALACDALDIDTLPFGTTIDFYHSDCDVLIFIAMPPSYYGFDNFEDVIAACKNCKAENSSLYYYDGEYILFVSLPDLYLSEFARNIPAGRHYLSFLKEHGKTIISGNAVNFVKNTF